MGPIPHHPYTSVTRDLGKSFVTTKGSAFNTSALHFFNSSRPQGPASVSRSSNQKAYFLGYKPSGKYCYGIYRNYCP